MTIDAEVDSLTWKGRHLATVKAPDGSNASLVALDKDIWDAGQGSKWNMVDLIGAPPPKTSEGQYVGLLAAKTPETVQGNHDGTPSWKYGPGGDGSPGTLVIHTDMEGIVGPRLRNPAAYKGNPYVELAIWASLNVSTAHWWEICCTPVSQGVIGADMSAVPGAGDEATAREGNPGPGPSVPMDAYNLICAGDSDVPQSVGGFRNAITVDLSLGGKRQNRNTIPGLVYFGKNPDMSLNYSADLTPLTVRIYRDHTEVFVGNDDVGPLQPLVGLPGTPPLPLGAPWDAFWVHFFAVTYQADHHPQQIYGGRQHRTFFRGLGVDVSPRLYDRTASVLGFRGYDLRDTKNYGPPVNGFMQPNAKIWNKFTSTYLVGPAGGTLVPNGKPDPLLTSVEAMPDLTGAVIVRAVYDTRCKGTGSLSCNGGTAVTLPNEDTVPGGDHDNQHWVRRSADFPATDFKSFEQVKMQFHLTGEIQLDRFEFEICFGEGAPVPVPAPVPIPTPPPPPTPAPIFKVGDAVKVIATAKVGKVRQVITGTPNTYRVKPDDGTAQVTVVESGLVAYVAPPPPPTPTPTPTPTPPPTVRPFTTAQIADLDAHYQPKA